MVVYLLDFPLKTPTCHMPYFISKMQMRNQSCQSAAGEPQDEGHPGLHGRPIS